MSSAQNLTKKITITMMMDDDDEIQLTAVRRLVEVYSKYLSELVYNKSHVSLEKQGNCTMIIMALAASLLSEGELFQSVFGKEKWNDNNQIISHFLELTLHTCQTDR
jgi:hypothetical protein